MPDPLRSGGGATDLAIHQRFTQPGEILTEFVHMFDTQRMTAPLPLSAQPVRTLVLWCPNWPIVAFTKSLGSSAPEHFALASAGRVVAVSEGAAGEAVDVGLRVREAQVRCPGLTVLAHDPAVDERHFAPVLRAIETVVPHVQVLRPGSVAVRITGAARFYGGEDAVIERLLDQTHEAELPDVRIAIAQGLFAAEQAAFSTSAERPVVNLSATTTIQFLRTLPVETIAAFVGQPEMAKTLRRMGIRNLGSLARLPRRSVHSRFGDAGLRARLLAEGRDTPLLAEATVPTDLSVRALCDPPSVDVEIILATIRPRCVELTERLTRASLVCHEMRVELSTEAGVVHARQWRHTWPFGTDDLVERVRWQLDDFGAEHLDSHDGITSVRVTAESPTPANEHAQGLWGERPEEHIVHTVTSLQHELGHGGVRSASLVGGRLLHERQSTRPWGDAPPRQARLDQPWPGALPGPAPATVFERAQPAQVCACDGSAVTVDPRGRLSGTPSSWRPAHDRSAQRQIVAWNGPWPVRQHWWQKPLQINRFQIIDDQSHAWLLVVTADGWWIEARYD